MGSICHFWDNNVKLYGLLTIYEHLLLKKNNNNNKYEHLLSFYLFLKDFKKDLPYHDLISSLLYLKNL